MIDMVLGGLGYIGGIDLLHWIIKDNLSSK
jgi:hypothetical protein